MALTKRVAARVPDAARIPAPDPQDRDVVDPVRGVVLGPDTRPLPRAKVTLFRRTRDWPRQDRDALQAPIWTAGSGRFQFGVARARDLELQVEASGFATQVIAAPPQVADLVVRVQQGHELAGRVLGPDNAPCGDCEVLLEARGVNQTRAFATRTDNGGDFVFAGIGIGDYRLVARHPDFRPEVQSYVPIWQSRSYSLKFGALGGLFVSGTVVSAESGEPLPDCDVLVFPNLPTGFLSVPYRARSDEGGVFRVRGLGPGAYRMEIRHPDYSSRQRLVSLKSRSVSGLQMQVHARVPVRGRVTGFASPGGQRLRLVSFFGEIDTAVLESDGSFRFAVGGVSRGLAELELEAGSHGFKSTHSRWRRVQLADEDGEDLQLEVIPVAAVTGRVIDPAGQPLAGVQVSTPRQKVGDHLGILARRAEVLAVTDLQGAYRILGLEPGEVSLEFHKDRFATNRLVARIPGAPEVPEASQATVKMEPPGMITGRVTRAGAPVAGALVAVGKGLRVIARTNTDSLGRYNLSGLPTGLHKVNVRFGSLGVEYAESAILVEPGSAVEGVDIELPRGRQIEGRVADAEDLPIPGAIVEAASGVTATTDGSGRFKLDVDLGAISLTLRLRGIGPPITSIVVGEEQSLVPIRVASARRASLRATVVGLPSERPVSGVMVKFAPVPRDGSAKAPKLPPGMIKDWLESIIEFQRKWARFRGQLSDERWVDTDSGILELANLPVGETLLTVRAKGFEPYQGRVVLEGGQPLDLGRIALRRGARVRGVVVDSWGKPIRGAQVVLGRESELSNPAAQTGYTTDARGRFTVRGVSHRNRRLFVKMNGFATHRHDLDFPRDALSPRPVRIQLEPGATIQVNVVDQDGQAVGFEAVRLFRQLEPIAMLRTDERGVAAFEHLSKDEYHIVLPGRPRAGVRREEVTDALGAKRYRVTIPVRVE